MPMDPGCMENYNPCYDRRNDPLNLPPGFRFHPTDEELVAYYLLKKVVDCNFTSRAIAEVDLNKCEPWFLPSRAKMGEQEWYFFSTRGKKYPTGSRTNRATEAGYWKATGKDREIYSSNSARALVGMKKTLVFYMGRAPRGEKSNWVMHEYRFEGKLARHYYSGRNFKEEWVICRVFQKSVAGVKKRQSTVSSQLPPLLDQESCFNPNSMMSDLPAPLPDHATPMLILPASCLGQHDYFSAVAPPSMHSGGCVSQWPPADVQELMVHTQLDCMWNY